MSDLIDRLRVTPGRAADLERRDPRDDLGFDGKQAAHVELDDLADRLGELQGRLYAEGSRAVLLVLQGMDASGKDGTVRRVLAGVNPQGCNVVSFKAPSDGELAHDYLWRVHAVCPPRGHLGVFNRSHYEDVLAARLSGAVDHDRCRLRYRHLREFERMLHEEGTSVVKVFLHLSKDEQRQRLQDRLDDPTKAWKFKLGDLDVRKQWDDYQRAYEEVLTETSSDHAPWFVVPADRNWVRDLAVSRLLAATFDDLDPQLPAPDPGLRGVTVE